MPIIAETEPDATPRSTARQAPASSPTSSTSSPSGPMRMPEPAAAAEEDDGEGERPLAGAEVEADRDRLAEERHLDVGAERHVREREDADRQTRQGEREAGGQALGSTSRYGGSENPSNGIRSLIVSTKARIPTNSIFWMTTSTSGLPDEPALNDRWSKAIRTSGSEPTRSS